MTAPTSPPKPAGRSRITPAQLDTVDRLRWRLQQPGAHLSEHLTVDGHAVVYVKLRGQRRAAYIDRDGWAVTQRDGRWVRIDTPYNPPQQQLLGD